MADGIRWEIDLDAKTGGAAETITALDRMQARADAVGRSVDRVLGRMEKLTRGVGSDAGWSKGAVNLQALSKGSSVFERELKDVQKACDRANAEIECMGGTTKDVEPLWRSVFKGELAMEALRTAARLTWEAMKWGAEEASHAINVAAGEERTRGVFRNILGPDEGKATLDYLGKFAGMAEFTKGQMVEMSTGLLQAGLRGADFRNAIGAAADVAATSINKIEGYAGAVASLERIYRTGRVEGRALAGLHLKSADVQEQISKDTGLDRETIKKRLEEGTLDARDAMGSIYTVMEQKSGKKLGALGDEMADNVQSKLEKIRDIPEAIFKSLADSPGYKMLSESLTDIIDKMGPDSPAGKALKTGLGDLLGFIGKEMKGINWGEVSTGIKDWVELTKSFVILLEKGAKLVGMIAHPFAEAMRQWGDWGKESGEASIRSMGDENERNWNEAVGGDENERNWNEAVGAGAGDAIEKGTRDALGAHSPSSVFAEIGADCAAGFALGFAAPPPVSAAPSIGSLPPVGGGRGGLTVGDLHLAVTVQVPGTSATPEEITASVGQQLPSMLLAALEQLNTQAGLA